MAGDAEHTFRCMSLFVKSPCMFAHSLIGLFVLSLGSVEGSLYILDRRVFLHMWSAKIFSQLLAWFFSLSHRIFRRAKVNLKELKFINLLFLIDLRKRERDLLFYVFVRWLFLVCTLTRDQPATLVFRDDTNQLSTRPRPNLLILIFLFIVLLVSSLNTLYLALAPKDFLLSFFFLKVVSFYIEIPVTHFELIFMCGIKSRLSFMCHLFFNSWRHQ